MKKKDEKASPKFWGVERILFPDEPLELSSAGEPVPVDMDFDFLAAGARRRRAPAGPEEAVPVNRKLEFLTKPPSDAAPRRARSTTVALLVHAGLLAVALLLPLVYTETLTVRGLERTWLATPPLPPPPPPPLAALPPAPTRRARLVRPSLEANLTLPTTIPEEIPRGDDLEEVELAALPLGVEGGVPGGVPGGQIGGVLGGVLGGAPATATPPARAERRPPRPVRVGGKVRPPRLLYHVQPNYPLVARQARIQGEVIIRAIIDVEGRVTQMEVVSGHPLLVSAATEAVRQWRYQPTFLNGQPVPLIFEVTVTFTLG